MSVMQEILLAHIWFFHPGILDVTARYIPGFIDFLNQHYNMGIVSSCFPTSFFQTVSCLNHMQFSTQVPGEDSGIIFWSRPYSLWYQFIIHNYLVSASQLMDLVPGPVRCLIYANSQLLAIFQKRHLFLKFVIASVIIKKSSVC